MVKALSPTLGHVNIVFGKASKTPSSPRDIKNELETSLQRKWRWKGRGSFFHQEKQQRKIEWVSYQEQANILQNDFNGKVIELRIEALKNYQKATDLKLSLYLQQNFEPNQAFFNLPWSQGTLGTTSMGRATTGKNESDVRILGSKTCTEQQGTKRGQFDDGGRRLFFLRSLPDESLKD